MRPAFLLVSAAWLLLSAAWPATAASPDNCAAPPEMIRLTARLPRTEAKLRRHEPVTIVALGSSSTAGFGASSPARTYPGRLAVELGALLPGEALRVQNKGIGGEVASDMVKRFESDVFALRPDLVIWQVGTNAVLRDLDLQRYDETVRSGVERLKRSGIDVILMDLQFAPKVTAHPGSATMQSNLAKIAADEGVALFRRFDIMRHWVETRQLNFKRMLLGDGLHLNDVSYGCVAHLLATSIAEQVRAGPQETQTSRR